MIWIDITNLPHVLFFRDFIKKNDCLVTTRDFGDLSKLLEKNQIEHLTVGRHGGKDIKEKLLESSRRVEELTKILTGHDVTIAIAKHSVELPRVSYGLGIPSIFILDNEHAEKQNRLTLPIVDTLITPKALDRRLIQAQGADPKKIKSFYGVCEASHLKGFKPDRRSVRDHGEYVVVRPEPYMASYFKSEAKTQTLIDRLDVLGYRVIVLPRSNERYKNAVHLENVDTLNLLYHAQAFFGGGGTMNREAAILGVPAISFYSQELLGVDRLLIKLGLLHHTHSFDFDLEQFLSDNGRKKKAERILKTFEDPHMVIKEAMA